MVHIVRISSVTLAVTPGSATVAGSEGRRAGSILTGPHGCPRHPLGRVPPPRPTAENRNTGPATSKNPSPRRSAGYLCDASGLRSPGPHQHRGPGAPRFARGGARPSPPNRIARRCGTAPRRAPDEHPKSTARPKPVAPGVSCHPLLRFFVPRAKGNGRWGPKSPSGPTSSCIHVLRMPRPWHPRSLTLLSEQSPACRFPYRRSRRPRAHPTHARTRARKLPRHR